MRNKSLPIFVFTVAALFVSLGGIALTLSDTWQNSMTVDGLWDALPETMAAATRQVTSVTEGLILFETADGDEEEPESDEVEEGASEEQQVQSGKDSVKKVTGAGVDVSDPSLFTGVDLGGDSSTATVMGMATGYHLGVYQRFVGSLRKSGYKGNIILGVAPDAPQNVVDYLIARDVTVKKMEYANCTYRKIESNKRDIFKKTQCEKNYPDIKVRWSRFPLQRDWLLECDTCTGPVLTMDVRDSFFQRNPFGPGSPVVRGLQVFQEDPRQTTEHWLTRWPIRDCKNVVFTEPMLCSGTTIGTRAAMLKYLEVMYAEMKVWIVDEKCRFDINGDDQSMHNYLFYTGQLPFATSIINRSGGIVNTVGKQGAIIWKANVKEREGQGMTRKEAERSSFPGATDKLWIGLDQNVTDSEGYFSEADGSRSRVVHQYDRFGTTFSKWLMKKDFVRDSIEQATESKNTEIVSDEAFGGVTKQLSGSMKKVTDAGVDVSDPSLFETVDLKGDSSTATVMGMASGYDLSVYTRFVGSLRKSGYQGNIILGVAPDVSQEALDYFEYRGVTAKVMHWANCTYRKIETEKTDIFKKSHCEVNYPDIKVRWSRFPLQRDWLLECKECTGPVLTMDVRDSLFQQDPFGPGSPPVTGLQVFEEDPSQTTKHWLTEWPIRECKGLAFEETMLCSGTTIGTRAAMLKYLEVMYEEMKVWINVDKCRFDINGDDQSIHNYLFYTGQLPFAEAIRNRQGGIVNTVGKLGSDIRKEHTAKMQAERSISKSVAEALPFEGADIEKGLWIGTQYNVTDSEGWFIEADGSKSRVIHQYDRFGHSVVTWVRSNDALNDKFPPVSTQEATASTPDSTERKLKTETGVDVSDPSLFKVVDLHGDSSTATVMGLASGYDLSVYERFVGTLRKSGFKGNIILGVAPDVSQEVLDYFTRRNVIHKKLEWANCTYRKPDNVANDIFKKSHCEVHYPDIKVRWSRFPLQRDWLAECEACTGPVLTMDVRDSYFQEDPFGPGSPAIKGLQVVEEHASQTTEHWLTDGPIKKCKGISFVKPMLCSGTTIGTREAMLKYFEVMYEEMKVWISREECRNDRNGDDQSIHNYLYYTRQLPFATATPQGSGIVNTVGKIGATMAKNIEQTC